MSEKLYWHSQCSGLTAIVKLYAYSDLNQPSLCYVWVVMKAISFRVAKLLQRSNGKILNIFGLKWIQSNFDHFRAHFDFVGKILHPKTAVTLNGMCFTRPITPKEIFEGAPSYIILSSS